MRKIRMISRIAAAAITACMLFSNQPWTYAAAEVKQDSELAVQYVSEIKMFYGSSEDEAKKDCVNEGYIFSSTNMNAGANTEIGAYLGYKTTEDPDEAITDITLLDMKNSHYEEMSYQEFLDKHVTEFDTQAGEIMKLVNDFRDKYDAGSPNAIAAYDSLNLIYISDTESPDAASNLLGNYMLNKADRTFFAKFIQRGNSMVLNKIISILANATADYNADHTTWVERAKVSELPTMMQKAKSATLNEYNARFGDPAKTLIQDIQEFAAVYAEAKERYEAFLAVMEEHGLHVDAGRIYFGGFRPIDGKLAAEEMLRSKLALPDAVHDRDGFHLPSTVLLSRSTTTISSARMVLYGIPDGFITTSPFSRSIPETFPHVNVTSPYLGKSIFASYTCSFSSSSIVFTRFCLLYPKQDRELKLFFYMRHISCHTSQNTHVEDKQEKKASSLRITPSEHRHNLRRRSRLLLRSRALRSHRQII